MQYRFQIDNRPAGPVHADWALAAQDAVAQGYAVWVNDHAVQMDSQGGIDRIAELTNVR